MDTKEGQADDQAALADPGKTSETTIGSPVSNDEENLAAQIEANRVAALADQQAQQNIAQGSDGNQSGDTSGGDAGAGDSDAGKSGVTNTEQQQVPQEDAPLIPVPGIGDQVFLNIPGSALRTAALVTGYANGRSEINVTAFPDGEVPRPISAVPHIRVKPDAGTVWYE